MEASRNQNYSIFFNQSFDKKRLKALISWIFKQSGEAEALRAVDFLKETGFRYATKAGISIGLHDLTTPIQKSWLISESQLAMNTTNRDFIGARITTTERSQRIIDTWHRASESLSKQVVDYFGIYDRFNPVYIMALSGARGNFSQVRQLIGMRGLMADQQGKIVNFPIRSNLREGLTLTEYFISCSGARKGLVDTALRTADTGYLTRRLVDVSHHVVVKRIRCNTNRGIAFKSLQSYNKVLLSLKERLVGRVLAENITKQNFKNDEFFKSYRVLAPGEKKGALFLNSNVKVSKPLKYNFSYKNVVQEGEKFVCDSIDSSNNETIAEKDQEISLKLASKIVQLRDKVYLRSPLTCGFTHSVCQLCYGWSISQGSLVSLGDAVGVIAAQSIGEPGTQLTMRTFHTGGVFSGDLLQEIRAPHSGKIEFSKAFQGVLIRTAHGRIAFLSKTEGSLILSNDHNHKFCTQGFTKNPSVPLNKNKSCTNIPIPAFTMLFVRQGEKVENNQLLAEFSIRTKEGNQPIKTEQTIFAHLTGRVIEDCSGKLYTKPIKESALLLNTLQSQAPRCNQSLYHASRTKLLFTPPSVFATKNCMNTVPNCMAKQNFAFGRGTKVVSEGNERLFGVGARRNHYQAKALRLHKTSRHGWRTKFCTVRGALQENVQKNVTFVHPYIPSITWEEETQKNKKTKLYHIKGFRFVKTRACKRYNFLQIVIRERKIQKAKPYLKWKLPHAKRSFAKILQNEKLSLCTKLKPFSKTFTRKFILSRTLNKRFLKAIALGLLFKQVLNKLEKKISFSRCKVQILSSHKIEDLEDDICNDIEPVRSGRLGFLKILSTRLGATFDYISPIKSFTLSFLRVKKAESLKKGIDYTNLGLALQSFNAFNFVNKIDSYAKFFDSPDQKLVSKEDRFWFSQRWLTKELFFGKRNNFFRANAFRNQTSIQSKVLDEIVDDPFASTPLTQQEPENLKIFFSSFAAKYFHPEFVKENRFFLQTIAEYGDIVDEMYKNKSL